MTPTEDEMDALNDVIRRLRAELERVREAGRAVVEIAGEETHDPCLDMCLANLKAALEGEEG